MKKTILNVLMIVCILVAVGCGGYLGYYYYTSYQTENEFDDLRNLVSDKKTTKRTDQTDSAEEFVDVDGVFIQKKFEQLYKKNKDFIGWITIDDTHIDYPVMYSPSDQEGGEYYIHRDYDGKYSSAGLPFIDANCSVNPATDNIIIYGHNMKNGSMFGHLKKFVESDETYKKSKYFWILTPEKSYRYEIISAYTTGVNSDTYTLFKGPGEEFEQYLQKIKGYSEIQTEENELTIKDKIVTLSTCTGNESTRFVVQGKRVNSVDVTQ